MKEKMTWGQMVMVIWCICATVDLVCLVVGLKMGAASVEAATLDNAFWITFWWGAFKAVNHYIPKIDWEKVKEWHSDNF